MTEVEELELFLSFACEMRISMLSTHKLRLSLILIHLSNILTVSIWCIVLTFILGHDAGRNLRHCRTWSQQSGVSGRVAGCQGDRNTRLIPVHQHVSLRL